MTHPTHSFETPCAREGWAIGLEYLLEAHPCGQLHNFSGRPVTLPAGNERAIQDEVAQIKRTKGRRPRGLPHEL